MHEDTYKQHLKEVGKKIMYQVIMTVHHGRVDSCHSIQVQINGCKVIGTYIWDKVHEGQTYTKGQVVIVF